MGKNRTGVRDSLAIFALAVAVSGNPAAAQELRPDADGWLSLDAVGVDVEVPAPFVSYVDQPIVFEDPRGAEIARYPSGIEFVRFALANYEATGESPHAVAKALHDPVETPEITYEVDEPNLGVVSGYDGSFIFYSGCKRRQGRIACFSLVYPERYRALIDHTISRVLRSLR